MSRWNAAVPISLLMLGALVELSGCGGVRSGNPEPKTANLTLQIGAIQSAQISSFSLHVSSVTFISADGVGPVTKPIDQNILVTDSATALSTIEIPAGNYSRVEMSISAAASSQSSIQIVNDHGTHISSSTLNFNFPSPFSADETTSKLVLGLQPFAEKLNDVTSPSEMDTVVLTTTGTLNTVVVTESGPVAPVSLVQEKTTGLLFPGGSTHAVSFTQNNTAGNTIVVLVQTLSFGANMTLASVTDSRGNAYTIVGSSLQTYSGAPNYAFMNTQLAYATNIQGGANTVTSNFSSANYVAISIYELTPSMLDQVGRATGYSNRPTATVNTSANGEFAFAWVVQDNGVGLGNFDPGSGWTLDQAIGGGSAGLAIEYRAQSSAGPLEGRFNALTGAWALSIATFKPN